ncbi:MAG: phosphatidylglycerol:prolipoprotein diacylglycerol transferase [Candidatus Marinamargulisbacteria bacterium]|jgi:phosphatidylglycerol:prolipoprotein diacylglycerol transferase
MIHYPNIDPVFLKIGILEIRWYGLAYMAGVLLGFFYLRKHFLGRLKVTSDQLMGLMSELTLGILLGGRIGYILFYDVLFYLSNPKEILAFWNGGMSFHGGAIGGAIAFIWFGRRHRVSIWALLDLFSIGGTFGLLFGRLSNFINGELYGRVTDVPWGMVFPSGGPQTRHPSQLYEAFFEGFVIFMILRYLMKSNRLSTGQLGGVFLILYGSMRFFLEYCRQPDAHLGVLLLGLSMGQLLCLATVSVGGAVFYYRR